MTVIPSRKILGLWSIGGFLMVSPLVTYGLLVGRGLPGFAVDHLISVLIWVFQVSWIPALFSGILLWIVLSSLGKAWSYFTAPYDFGRAFSLGAITGTLAEALASLGYRQIVHHLFSNFWIGGAMIAGCFTGALITSVLLYRFRSTVSWAA